jgi:hypothetical protein
MEADFDRWSKRLVQTLGKENVTQTIAYLYELKGVLDADAGHFKGGATGGADPFRSVSLRRMHVVLKTAGCCCSSRRAPSQRSRVRVAARS